MLPSFRACDSRICTPSLSLSLSLSPQHPIALSTLRSNKCRLTVHTEIDILYYIEHREHRENHL